MKMLSFVTCSVCLLAMESNAFSGSITTRNIQDTLLSGVRLRPIPRVSSNSVIIPQTRSSAHTQHPLFGTSSKIARVERTSLKTRLQMVFIIFYRWVSQLLAHRRIRLPLAVLMTTWMLQFGGMVGVSQTAHAAASRTTTVSSRPATKTSKVDKSDKDTTSKWDRHKRRAVIALGFGASLYSVKTYRKPTKGDDDEDATPINGSNNAPALKAVEPTTVDKKLELEDIVLEPSATSEETSADSAAPSTSALNTIDKKDEEDDNPITKFLDAVGANPEVVFGFLGSTLSFIVSEDILISGITFAWIFKLFKESEAPKFTDAELKDVEEDMIAEIEQVETTATDPAPVASLDDDDCSSEVVVEEYRPEEIMAKVPTVPDEEESESLVEEIVAIKEEVIEEPQASTVEEVVVEEIVPEPQASTVEEVAAEEIAPEPEASTVQEVVVEEIAPEPEASTVEEVVVEETVPKETVEYVVPEEEEEEEQQSPSTLNGEMVQSSDTNGKVETSAEQSKVPMSLADRAYKVVMDLGLIEWERNKREKQL